MEAEHAEARALMEADADGVMHYIDGLQALWDKALVSAARNVKGAETSAADGEVGPEKFSPREIGDPQLRKDASLVTEADVKALLQMCKGKTSKNDRSIDGSYIPVGNNTPAYLLSIAKAKQAPLIMQVLKASDGS